MKSPSFGRDGATEATPALLTQNIRRVGTISRIAYGTHRTYIVTSGQKLANNIDNVLHGLSPSQKLPVRLSLKANNALRVFFQVPLDSGCRNLNADERRVEGNS